VSRSVYVALVRHAMTAWNAERRAQGQSDLPLSPAGHAQASRWRLPPDLRRLDAEGRLGWVTSPLRRAMETAGRLGGAAPAVEPRLAERHYGDWTGQPLDAIDAGAAGTGWAHRPPGGESAAEVLARARAWLDDLAARPGPDTWLAVTHSGVIRVLVAAAVGWDLESPAPLRLLPERLHRVRRRGDGHLQLVTLNEPLNESWTGQP
jgi:probable phosphoglycerate mutase